MTTALTELESKTDITTDQIRRFAAAWFAMLDAKAPVEEFARFLTPDRLKMHFPGADIADLAGFARWHHDVTHLFFDQSHNLATLDAVISGDGAVVDLVVGWQASWFEPPAPKSKRTAADVSQRWTVQRSSRNAFGLEIVTYDATVAPFRVAPGFARV